MRQYVVVKASIWNLSSSESWKCRSVARRPFFNKVECIFCTFPTCRKIDEMSSLSETILTLSPIDCDPWDEGINIHTSNYKINLDYNLYNRLLQTM